MNYSTLEAWAVRKKVIAKELFPTYKAPYYLSKIEGIEDSVLDTVLSSLDTEQKNN